jgi:hypothetical protein
MKLKSYTNSGDVTTGSYVAFPVSDPSFIEEAGGNFNFLVVKNLNTSNSIEITLDGDPYKKFFGSAASKFQVESDEGLTFTSVLIKNAGAGTISASELQITLGKK